MVSDFSSDPNPSSTSSAGPSDEVISPALRRRLQICFERGSQMAKEQDYDYAQEMFAECVAKDPSNLVYVEAMMDNLQKKYGNNKKGARFRGFGGKGAIKKAVSEKRWHEVLQLGTDFLKINPWHVAVLRAMASACEALHYNEVELRYLKNALDANHKNVAVNRHCALSLARMGQFDQAIACWHRIEELKKGDEEPPRMISQLTLNKSRKAAGIDDEARPASAETAPPQAKVTSTPSATETRDEEPQKPAAIPLNRRQKLEKAIAKDPSEITNYLELADLLTRDERHPEAENVLTRALTASGNDLKVRERLENVQIRRARTQLVIAEKRALSLKTEDATELVKKLKSDLNRLELEIFGARSQRYPENGGLKYELGVRLKRAGNYAEAVKYLQQVHEDPQYRVASMLEMGECLQHGRQYQKALRCYLDAAEKAGEDTERKKRSLYRGGVLAQALKQTKQAENCLSQLVQIDAQYRDAAARLDKLRQIRDK